MPDYANTKVYKMEVPGVGFYVGHCTTSLAQRRAIHAYNFRKGTEHKVYAALRAAGATDKDIQLTLIEAFPCADRTAAQVRERHYIETLGCRDLHTVIPARTAHERYLDNKDAINAADNHRYATDPAYRAVRMARGRAFYAANRDACIEYQKVWQAANPDKVLAYRAKYKALREAARTMPPPT